MRSKKILIIFRKKHLYALFLICLLLLIAPLLALLICNHIQYYESINYPDGELTYPVSGTPHPPKIAIIIDDFGQDQAGVDEMMSIHRHLTFAIMPFLDYSKQNAIDAHKRGYEVILHLPMQSQQTGVENWLGKRPIKIGYQNEDIKKIVQDSINSVPYIAGANIHMGSLASENEKVISCVLSTLKEKNLYFIDSLTSPRTVCKSVARKIGIKFAQRNVFLEHSSKSKYHIKKQLSTAGDIALKYGYAIVIGHVGSAGGEVTAEAIKEMIPELESKGIEFSFASELLN